MRNGKILRQRRKELGMSQEELADSVVSPSYLSRIENDKTEADEETLKLLFQKVGVDYRKQTSNTKTIKRLLQEWEKPLLQNERKKSHQIYINLSPLVTDMVEIQLQLEYHIKSIRLFILKKELSKVKDCIVFLDDFYERLTSRNRFFYHKHVGNYEFYAGNFEKAESHFAKAALDFTEVHLEKLELADLHLLYASALFKTNKESLCLSYADSALQIFQSRYKTKPCLKIHVLLGSCYSRARDFPSALSNYEQAKELAELLNQDVDIGIIEHNIATTKYRMNNKKEAINLLKEAMKHKKNNNIRFLTSLNMLLNIYYEMDYTREIRCLLKEYSHLPSKLSRETIQVKEFLFFLFFLSKPQNEWEAYVTNEFYPFLQTKKENRQLINYTKIIANYYENNGSYKNATYYFKRALEISEHTNNL